MPKSAATGAQRATQQATLESARQSTLTDAEFNEVRAIIKEMTGISMSDSKRQLIYRRLSSRMKALNIGTFQEYLTFLKSGDATEVELFSNAVTTNLTSFFREHHHFDYLANTILPEIVTHKGAGNKRLRIWSAGCSTGEEPYSIAITLLEAMPNLPSWDAKLLCTDLDSDVLAKSREGVYPLQSVEKIPAARLQRWFQKGTNERGPIARVRGELQELITFKRLNLMHEWPMRGKFDVIFCRNVVIYFDKPTQRVLMDRYADMLEDDGYLILGHSESLHNVSDRFALIGKTIYRKKH